MPSAGSDGPARAAFLPPPARPPPPQVMHLLHISRMNTTFVVHPRAFVVHVPHPRSATQWLTKVTRQREVLHDLFVEVKTDIFKQKFVPVTSFPHICG